MDELQVLHAGAVRPPEGKSAASEGPDGETRGSIGTIRMREMVGGAFPQGRRQVTGDDRLPKRVMSGELENAGKHEPGGEGERMDGLRGR